MVAITPVENTDCIWTMDALRGFAILGIFIAIINSGFAFYDTYKVIVSAFAHSLDKTLIFWKHILIEGKFSSIFSLLFGWNVYLQLQRMETRTLIPVQFLRRRLFIMFLLGLTHLILIWTGDIVAFYALVGCI